MSKWDKIILIFLIIIAAVIWILSLTKSEKAQYLFIKKDGKELKRITLPAERLIEIEVNGKKWNLEIDGYKARVKSSDCPKKLCIGEGWISYPGQVIICIPFRLTALLYSEKGGAKFDAISK